MYDDILKLIERLEGDMENADRQAVDKTVSTQQQHYYAGKAAAFSDCTHLLTLLLQQQPNGDPQPQLQQADGSGSLPTAEEITAFSWQWAEDDNGHGPDKYFADCNFKAGARWMLSKVVGNDR